MDFGFQLHLRGAPGNPDHMRTLAQRAEALGYSYIGFSDHVVVMKTVGSVYPYSDTGVWPAVGGGEFLEQLTAMTFCAAVTSKIRLLSSVMVLPHRPVLLTAKILATVDVLSKGRVTAGVGTGWMAEEIAQLGGPPFEKRGVASREYIEAFRELWTKDQPVYDGEFVKFRDLLFDPKPVQKGGVPIWIGGEGLAARRRAGRLGNGWYPTIRNPNEPLDTPELLAAGIADVRKHAAEAGRDPKSIDIGLFATRCNLGVAGKGREGQRLPFTGTAQEILADARGYRDAGVNHIMVGTYAEAMDDLLAQMDGIANEVMAKV